MRQVEDEVRAGDVDGEGGKDSWVAGRCPQRQGAEKPIPPRCWERVRDVSSVAQLCLTLCDPMDCSMPGFRVHHQLPELAQTHVHRVSDAIQPSHPLSCPSPPAFNLSQHQGLFQ